MRHGQYFFLSDPEFWLWLLRLDLRLQNLLLMITASRFRVMEGRFGTRLVPRAPWTMVTQGYMSALLIRELWLGDGYYAPDADYAFLRKLPKLCALRITGIISDPSPLKTLVQLRSLELPEVSKNFGLDLSRFSKLEDLCLNSWFTQAQSLFQLQLLKELALSKYPGKEGSSPFGELTNLERLWLSACGLAEIESFSSLAKLQDISLLLMKHLKSLRGLESLTQLRKLRIENCPNITSLEPLRHLSNLESLRIIDCGKLESLEPLADLPRLGTVKLSKDGRSVIVSKRQI